MKSGSRDGVCGFLSGDSLSTQVGMCREIPRRGAVGPEPLCPPLSLCGLSWEEASGVRELAAGARGGDLVKGA